jgi:hypothetical protein
VGNERSPTPLASCSHAASCGPRAVAIGDLDGIDGPDLVAVTFSSGNAWVLLNNGDGTFAPAVAYDGGRSLAVTIDDVDGKNGPDVITGNGSANAVSILPNNGDGTFGPRAVYGAGTFGSSVAIGQLDGSGGLDLAVAGGLDVSVLLSACGPTCPADTDDDGFVGVDDLLAVLADWGTDGSQNNGDVDGTGIVDVDDLLLVLSEWGSCA